MHNTFRIFFLLAILAASNQAQTDWLRWEGKQVSYEIKKLSSTSSKIYNENFGLTLLSFFRNSYATLISDLDGDNCPFHPSCSNFFVESVKEAGLFKGALMFSDRFIRDLNFFKAKNHYPIHISGKFWDSACNYTLKSEMIKYYPGDKLVD